MTQAEPTGRRSASGLLDRAFGTREVFRAWAVAAMILNVVIILTGAVVRLTSSGLGCPTWPRCTNDSLVPTGEINHHSLIEFGNRMITFILIAVALGALLAAIRSGGDKAERRLALYGLIGIPLEGVVGGIVVLTHLNPWTVSLHLLLSVWLVSVYTQLVKRTRDTPHDVLPRPQRTLAVVLFWWMMVTIWVGTIVTGAGPHSGSPGVGRNGLPILTMAKLHAWVVWVAVALTISALVLAWRCGHRAAARWAGWLLAAEMLQGAIGYTQYFTGLPIWLVIAHMTGIGLIVIAVTWFWFGTREPSASGY